MVRASQERFCPVIPFKKIIFAAVTIVLLMKRLYLYVLKLFFGPLFATFFVSLFVLMMNFLWKYIDRLVGKGLPMSVIFEFFILSAASLLSMALPLSVLLAAIMTFGNMGERFELLAVKAAGVSIVKLMRPLIVLILGFSAFSFYYNDRIAPVAMLRLKTLMHDITQTNPEFFLKEKVFVSEIPNYTIKVERKNDLNNNLYGVIIYDHRSYDTKAGIITADSGNLVSTANKAAMILTLYHGYSYSEMRNQEGRNYAEKPFRRDSFKQQIVILDMNTGISRSDDKIFSNSSDTKNVTELNLAIDSLRKEVAGGQTVFREQISRNLITRETDTSMVNLMGSYNDIKPERILPSLTREEQNRLISLAIARVRDVKTLVEQRIEGSKFVDSQLRRATLEWHKKFTLSLACLLFFFIGAPLGSIIRRGGFGLPVVVAVLFFILYYITDNIGRHMALEGISDVRVGVWLSSIILFPIGVFITYKATHDSALLNPEAYKLFLKRISSVFSFVRNTKRN